MNQYVRIIIASLTWRLLRQRLRRRGISADEAKTVKAFIEISAKVRPPAYANAGQQPINYFPGLAAQRWYHTNQFSWIDKLEEASAQIVSEFEALIDCHRFKTSPYNLIAKGDWKVCYLTFLGWKAEMNRSLCPTTAAIIDGMQDASSAGVVYFSISQPGTILRPHTIHTNTTLKYDFCLRSRGNGGVRIGDERRTWLSGKSLVYDSSWEHVRDNEGPGACSVLEMDIWHPGLSVVEKTALDELMKMSRKAAHSRRFIRRWIE